MVKYAEDHFDYIESKQDDHPTYGQQSDGYGRKISTRYLVRLNRCGPWRRVYCVCFSNAGSMYILVKGEMYMFRCDECLRKVGEWVKVPTASGGFYYT